MTKRGGEAVLEIVASETMYIVDDAGAAIRDSIFSGFDVIIAANSAYGSSIDLIFDQVEQGRLGGDIIWLDFGNDGIEVVFNAGNAPPDEVKAGGEQAIEDSKSVAVDVTLGG